MAEETAAEASTKVPVKMQDGTTVDFSGDQKAKKKILRDANGEPVGIRFDFRNGETRSITQAHVGKLAARFMWHGVSQKYGDEYAALKDVDDAVIAVDDLHDRIVKGEWSEERVSGGLAGASVLAQALTQYFKKSMDEVRAILKELKPKEKMALRAADGIRDIVAQLEAAKAKDTQVDTNALKARFTS